MHVCVCLVYRADIILNGASKTDIAGGKVLCVCVCVRVCVCVSACILVCVWYTEPTCIPYLGL